MKFFVSYTAADSDWAHWVAWILEKYGDHTVFVHEWEIEFGQNIPEWMNSRLDQADHLIGIFSPSYLDAIYSKSELWANWWSAPLGKDKRTIPIEVRFIEEWPPLVSTLKRLSLVGISKEIAQAKIVEAVEPRRRPDTEPRFPGMEDRSEPPFPVTFVEGENFQNRISAMGLSWRVFLPSKVNLSNSSHPVKFDWREVKNVKAITDVRDTGTCGSTVAFAVCAAMESKAILNLNLREDLDLSEAHLFFCGTDHGCSSGWKIEPALKRCKEVGVGLERDFPYVDSQQSCKEIPPYLKIKNWKKHKDAHQRRKYLMQSGPQICGFRVFEDMLYYSDGVYRPTTFELAGIKCGLVVGYDDDNACWIVKNDWGKTWGEEGFIRIGYGCCGIDSEYPFYDVSVEMA